MPTAENDANPRTSPAVAGQGEDAREEKLATEASPDNAPVADVLSYVLVCAQLWEPQARIIGNARAGDIARALSAALRPAPGVVEPCGGCGETDPAKRCIGCLHPFEAPAPAGMEAAVEAGAKVIARANGFAGVFIEHEITARAVIQASLPHLSASLSGEWQMVPKEPPTDMCRVDAGTSTTDTTTWNAAQYRAMLAAAPSPVGQEGSEG